MSKKRYNPAKDIKRVIKEDLLPHANETVDGWISKALSKRFDDIYYLCMDYVKDEIGYERHFLIGRLELYTAVNNLTLLTVVSELDNIREKYWNIRRKRTKWFGRRTK